MADITESPPASLRARVERFSSRMLEPRPSRLRDEKVVHDAVWGTVFLRKVEVALLDTSLMQRLRYLHQTGFAFFTYPSARHSRFEHSLGVLRQTDNHLRALSNRFQEHVTPEATSTLRLAALLHDCSHGMFSHTSEEIYRFLPDMIELIRPGGSYPNHKPSELIALFILGCARFREFIDFFAKSNPVHTDGKELADLITGNTRSLDPHKRWMVDIINGPLDADKLDYILRDGLHTGIPLTLDLDRFWLSTEVAYLPKGCVPSVNENQTRLVINRAGVNAAEQILFARFQLTSSVYHHHKIRSADCLFKSWVEKKQKEGKFTGTADFIEASDVDFLAEVRNLRRDQMLGRCLVISHGTAKIPKDFWEVVIRANKDQETAADLRRIAADIAKAAKLPIDRRHQVWIDLPPLPKVDDLGTTIVNLGTVKSPSYDHLENVFPVQEWKTSYTLKKWRGHVFAPIEHLSNVNKAAIRVLQDNYRLKFTAAATSICKL